MSEREGVIRFQADHRHEPLAAELAPLAAELAGWKRLLTLLGVVGRDPDRYGAYAFGNLSVRVVAREAPPGQRSFLISGSQTMGDDDAGDDGAGSLLTRWALVERYEPAANRVESRGRVPPSSESLTHGALYDLDPVGGGPPVGAVFHAHAPELWRRAAELGLPATAPEAENGTPQLAAEIARLGAAGRLGGGVLVMAGHEDGVLAFDTTPSEAGRRLVAALASAAAPDWT